MRFHPPDGTRFVRSLGTGTFFDVAAVEEGGVVLACKRLRPRLLRDPLGRAALAREVKALAAVTHHALPRVVRVGTDAAGPFALETLIEGTSLEGVREAWRARGRSVPEALFVHLACEACRELAELHGLPGVGFVHGDVAPDNVIAAPTGEVRFLDFGMSRVASGPDSPPGVEGCGSLPFAAPERARGEVGATRETDVYALAASLLWLVSEAPLVAASDEAAVLVEVCERGLSPRAPGSLGPGARATFEVLCGAVRLEPAERVSSARSLHARLGAEA